MEKIKEIKAPTQEIFEDMKSAADKIWRTYDNTYGYVDEKLERIDSIENVQDNAMVFYRMFDNLNQSKMIILLSDESIDYISKNK